VNSTPPANNELPNSIHRLETITLWLSREGQRRLFNLVAPKNHSALALFHGEGSSLPDNNVHLVAPCTTVNAKALRQLLPNLQPQPLGLKTSAGFGDRLGLATPGHVRALQKINSKTIAPIFAQQSIREMTRAKRTPNDVMNDATWGTFEAGWQGSVGADADHLKLAEHIDATVQAGFSFFTFDPGEHVDDRAETNNIGSLVVMFEQLPWRELESNGADFQTRYMGNKIDLETHALKLENEAVIRAGVKYGKAIAHIVRMYRHLASKNIPFDLEISVDETSYPTSPVEHIVIASELKRLGVKWQSIAPRFVGSFEKGIDYIGDLNALKENLETHAAIARAFGPYKLSLHSGSDKFSVYPLAAEATRGLVHLKTAGTSYLEALRVIAAKAPDLFKDIVGLSLERFEIDRHSYHLSCDTSHIPKSLLDGDLTTLLDQHDARQVLHVTFGSVLEKFKPDIVQALTTYDELYYDTLAAHFEKHLQPFVHFQSFVH
jgi:tagaturonate epimerase